jgi:hypothetical protein
MMSVYDFSPEAVAKVVQIDLAGLKGDPEHHNLGSTGSLSRARTPKTHS